MPPIVVICELIENVENELFLIFKVKNLCQNH